MNDARKLAQRLRGIMKDAVLLRLAGAYTKRSFAWHLYALSRVSLAYGKCFSLNTCCVQSIHLISTYKY